VIDPDHLLRGILAAATFIAWLLSGSFFGSIWPERDWPVRLVCIGLFCVLGYVFAGQVKAFNLGIRFDGFSFGGLFAYTVLLVGLVWFVRNRRGG
jgi:hypothetical protein